MLVVYSSASSSTGRLASAVKLCSSVAVLTLTAGNKARAIVTETCNNLQPSHHPLITCIAEGIISKLIGVWPSDSPSVSRYMGGLDSISTF